MKDFFNDIEQWEDSFTCNECGEIDPDEFRYHRCVSNGEVWECKNCNTEIVVGHKPNEDNY